MALTQLLDKALRLVPMNSVLYLTILAAIASSAIFYVQIHRRQKLNLPIFEVKDDVVHTIERAHQKVYFPRQIYEIIKR